MDLKGPPPKSSEESQKAVELPAPLYSASRTPFASIFLRSDDCIRLLQFPQEDILAIRGVIQRSWPKGIQHEGRVSSCYEFKLRTKFWSTASPQIVTLEIFAYLFSIGWILHSTTNDTMIFRKQQILPPETDWVCIYFCGNDRLRLTRASAELIASFRALLRSMDLLRDEWEEEDNVWEFKMKGNPWLDGGEDSIITRSLLLRMAAMLETHGWSFYLKAKYNVAFEHLHSLNDSWFCLKDKQWVSGMPVFRP